MNNKSDNLNWATIFMSIGVLVSKKSKDPSTKVGTCLIDPKVPKIISTGYNGFPIGIDEKLFSWSNDNSDQYKTKYPIVVHAELNAILLAKCDVSNCFLFITMFPCNECAKAIIQAGIKRIYFMSRRETKDKENEFFTLKMFKAAGVEVKSFNPRKITLNND